MKSDDNDNSDLCPICYEKMDSKDKTFFPCPCNFQICAFCYHNIISEYEPRCPNCREPYEESKIRIIQHPQFAFLLAFVFYFLIVFRKKRAKSKKGELPSLTPDDLKKTLLEPNSLFIKGVHPLLLHDTVCLRLLSFVSVTYFPFRFLKVHSFLENSGKLNS